MTMVASKIGGGSPNLVSNSTAYYHNNTGAFFFKMGVWQGTDSKTNYVRMTSEEENKKQTSC